jgi:SAM-dependent methyltransferase
MLGIDISASAVLQARAESTKQHLNHLATFQVMDANQRLPLAPESFDAIICTDSFNHMLNRKLVLSEWNRVLKADGRILFTDQVLTGLTSSKDIAVRSTLGDLVFGPPGLNEALLEAAGFRVLLTEDRTASVIMTSQRWHDAIIRHQSDLLQIEAISTVTSMIEYLEGVNVMAQERQMSRIVFVAT